jgi:hypothetical protein
MKRENTRTLDAIAEEITQLERANIFDIGGLLIEAKAQCEHGQWLPWLKTEFAWSADTAERYMNVARLGEKFRTVRNLKLAANTLYALAGCDDQLFGGVLGLSDDDLPDVIDELSKRATQKRLTPEDAEIVIERVVTVKSGRANHGDYPDATLIKLEGISDPSSEFSEPWHKEAIAALKELRPAADETADAIVDEIELAYLEAERIREAEEAPVVRDETDDILDGPPPVLPPPTTPPEPQKIGPGTNWAEQEPFDRGVASLLPLCSKPISRLIGTYTSAQLYEVRYLLDAAAAATDHRSLVWEQVYPPDDDGKTEAA